MGRGAGVGVKLRKLSIGQLPLGPSGYLFSRTLAVIASLGHKKGRQITVWIALPTCQRARVRSGKGIHHLHIYAICVPEHAPSRVHCGGIQLPLRPHGVTKLVVES